jgi:ferric-dicitrate binding protein FerR (iron transport regulator)
MSASLRDLIEGYLNGTLDETRLGDLEGRLRADPEARRYFVRYARLHTDLHRELRARQASERVLDVIGLPTPGPDRLRWRGPALAAIAAGLLAAVALGWWGVRGISGSRAESTVAWLVNAQNCTWAGGDPPGELRVGTAVHIDRGLAELHFRCGARIVLEGPANLELVSDTSARLVTGRLTARVPPEASGFEILSPQGRVIDLGTEFGVSVGDGGTTEVVVFEGKVEAHPADGPGAGGVSVVSNQSAVITAGRVTVHPADPDTGRFVRAIVPVSVTVPRTRRLTFDHPADGIRDSAGVGTGLTHRLPGTGLWLDEDDENLRLIPDEGRLELTTTNSDLNTQFRLRRGEYLGLRLLDLGFTGTEDFEVSATFPAIPALEFVGQFGLYAGTGSDRTIRGGLLSSQRQEAGQYTQFLVNNPDGRDTDLFKVGLLTTGTDLRMTLRRQAGQYTLTVENLTAGGTSTLSTRHPAFLDGERDLYVGLFGANTQSDVRRTLIIKEFRATVWTTAPDANR